MKESRQIERLEQEHGVSSVLPIILPSFVGLSLMFVTAPLS